MKNILVVGLLLSCIFLANSSEAVNIIFKDQQYSFQLLRALGAAPVGASDIGECLKTAYRIKEGDDNSWYDEWYKTAKQVESFGDKFAAQGHKLSASEAYLRASNYYRSAEFFLHTNPKDPRIMKTWGKSRDLFLKAIKLMDTPIIKAVKIPYEKTNLPGYLGLVDNSGKKRPLLMIQTGFDGTGEELISQVGFAALKRGYNILAFEGPGQGAVIREQGLPFRYDWEKVVTPVVDFALGLKEVDTGRIGLMGISFGGYLAPRAVAFEHRIKVCVANGGVYNFHENMVKNGPKDFESMLDDPRAEEQLDVDLYQEMKIKPGLRWAIGNGMWVFGVKSPTAFIKATRPYTLKDVVGKIKCKMLVVDSQDDKDMPGQAIKLFKALKGQKDYLLFTRDEGAEEHCQLGALMISNEKIFNWLDENL
ncbi:MAG: alpha/beta fold hydrolase [bacterium]